MVGKVVRQEIEKEIVFLHDADIDFVSLVRHGANKQAFRIIKQEGGVTENMNKIIQAILLSNDMTMEKLSSISELGYLTEAKTDEVVKFDHYKKYIQTDAKKFEKESLSLVRLSESGYAIVGKLKIDVDDKDVLILGTSKEDTKTKNVMDVEVPSSGVMMTKTFGELFHRELTLFLDIVFGALRQSSTDSKKRKSTVMSAFDAFRNFVSMGLDTLGKAKVDIEKIEVDKLTINKEEEMNEKEIQELITKTVSESVPESVTKSVESAMTPIKEIVEKLSKAVEDKESMEKKKDTKKEDAHSESEGMEKLAKTVAELTEKIEKIGNGLDTQPAASEKDDAEPDDVDREKGKESVFTGALFKI